MLFNIYIKELIDSLRDKRTLLLTVFLPILMMTALTFFYENMISGDEGETYTLAVESGLSSEQEMVLNNIENVELVTVEDLQETLLNGDAQAAIVFEAEFDEKVQAGEVGNIEIIGDTFSQNTSNLIYLVTSQLAEYERILVTERLINADVDPGITQAVAIEQTELSTEDSNIMLLALLIPMILAIAISVGSSPAAADLFAGEKERKTMEALLMTPVNRSTLLLAKFLTISSVGTIIGLLTLTVVIIEIAFFTEHLKAAVNLGDQMILIFAVGIIIIILYSSLMGAVLMITSIIGKTVKEAQSYASPILMLAVVPLIFITGLSVNEFTLNHFILPFVNIFAIITELIFGIVNWQHILIVIGSNLAVIVIIFIISRILFSKDKWVID
ncbi:ABC transporter permease [Oceanobacillus luteolus]|uniref:ABC transporter permease n=1 Tax=Oceanobacillus luteolus TaxID=1274358 RepID=A0ABW4HKY4_9BACI|nr:ABC transporter permease [Oceanobacillus luteolus]MCM3740770.1 ABC transporter permease [Oceanobacillus luteolus]